MGLFEEKWDTASRLERLFQMAGADRANITGSDWEGFRFDIDMHASGKFTIEDVRELRDKLSEILRSYEDRQGYAGR